MDDFFIIRKWYLYSCSNKEKEEFGAETKFYKSINPTGIINQLHCLTREKSERSSSRLNFLFLFSISNIFRVTKKNVEQIYFVNFFISLKHSTCILLPTQHSINKNYPNYTEYVASVFEKEQYTGGGTYTAEALRRVRVEDIPTARSGKKYVMIFTDGKSSDSSNLNSFFFIFFCFLELFLCYSGKMLNEKGK